MKQKFIEADRLDYIKKLLAYVNQWDLPEIDRRLKLAEKAISERNLSHYWITVLTGIPFDLLAYMQWGRVGNVEDRKTNFSCSEKLVLDPVFLNGHTGKKAISNQLLQNVWNTWQSKGCKEYSKEMAIRLAEELDYVAPWELIVLIGMGCFSDAGFQQLIRPYDNEAEVLAKSLLSENNLCRTEVKNITGLSISDVGSLRERYIMEFEVGKTLHKRSFTALSRLYALIEQGESFDDLRDYVPQFNMRQAIYNAVNGHYHFKKLKKLRFSDDEKASWLHSRQLICSLLMTNPGLSDEDIVARVTKECNRKVVIRIVQKMRTNGLSEFGFEKRADGTFGFIDDNDNFLHIDIIVDSKVLKLNAEAMFFASSSSKTSQPFQGAQSSPEVDKDLGLSLDEIKIINLYIDTLLHGKEVNPLSSSKMGNLSEEVLRSEAFVKIRALLQSIKKLLRQIDNSNEAFEVENKELEEQLAVSSVIRLKLHSIFQELKTTLADSKTAEVLVI